VNERLFRSRTDRMIGGVAAGIARAVNVDPTLVRIAWVILAFVTNGVAILIYFVLLFVIPEEPLAEPGFVPPGGTEGAGAADGTALASTDPLAATSRPAGSPRSATDNRNAALVFGLILVIVGGWFLVRQYLPQFDFDLSWPYVAVGFGVLLVVFALFGGRRTR
jgi:phage shock protein PspC (stress-responsive transcriptional regulator)